MYMYMYSVKGILAASNSTRASYLFQQDKLNYDVSYDTGDKSIQCGRVNDTFKLWLTWKAKVLAVCVLVRRLIALCPCVVGKKRICQSH